MVNSKIILLKNEREEWELPGGKIDKGEPIEECVVREIKEELNLDMNIKKLVDVWVYHILDRYDVLIVTFCFHKLKIDFENIKISEEHKEVGMSDLEDLDRLNLAEGYKQSIFQVMKSK